LSINESLIYMNFFIKIPIFPLVSAEYITALGITQIFISLFIVSYFLLKTAPLLIQKAWQGFVIL